MRSERSKELIPSIRRDAGVPAQKEAAHLTGIMLPQEHLVFGTRPHPVVLVRPLIAALIAFTSLIMTIVIRVHPIVRGHHATIALVSLPNGAMAAFFIAICLLIAVNSFFKAAFYYLAFRVVATNRRIFLKSGLWKQSIRPVGNASTAGAGLLQDVFGRKYDYGTIYTNFGRLRDLREPLRIYRAIEAVANGVEGDTWTVPARHVIAP